MWLVSDKVPLFFQLYYMTRLDYAMNRSDWMTQTFQETVSWTTNTDIPGTVYVISFLILIRPYIVTLISIGGALSHKITLAWAAFMKGLRAVFCVKILYQPQSSFIKNETCLILTNYSQLNY